MNINNFSHNQLKGYIKQQREFGYEINIPLNASKVRFIDAINNQLVPQQERRANFAHQIARSASVRKLKKNPVFTGGINKMRNQPQFKIGMRDTRLNNMVRKQNATLKLRHNTKFNQQVRNVLSSNRTNKDEHALEYTFPIRMATNAVVQKQEPEILHQEYHHNHARFPVSMTRFSINYRATEITPEKTDARPDWENMFHMAIARHAENRPYQPGDRVQLIFEDIENGHIRSSMNRNIPNLHLNNDDVYYHTAQRLANDLGTNYAIPNDGKLTVRVSGGAVGAGRNVGIKGASCLKTKKSIVRNNNKDNLCLYRAVAIALGYKRMDAEPIGSERRRKLQGEYKRICEGEAQGRGVQKKEALELLNKVERTIDDVNTKGGSDFHDVQILADKLGYVINILNEKGDFLYPEQSILKDADGKSIPQIYLLFYENHYDAINSIVGYLAGGGYYCDLCRKTYTKKDSHKCADARSEKRCYLCKRLGCDKLTDKHVQRCNDCNKIFYRQSCYDEHKRKKQCEKAYLCLKCNKNCNADMEPKNKHVCGTELCRNCQQFVKKDEHECYMRPAKKPPRCENVMYYDFEAYISEVENLNCFKENELVCRKASCNHINNKHVVNLVMWAYATPIDDKQMLKHDDVRMIKPGLYACSNIESFVDVLLMPCNYKMTCIAHNSKGYDANFIYAEMIKRSLKLTPIYQGAKLTYFDVKQIGVSLRFVDSLCFVAYPLAKFSKLFGIKELKKGYFPHEFNRPENYEYEGPIPDARYFGPDNMKKDDRDKFLSWHAKQTGTWNFMDEFIGYCESDVLLLREGCEKLRAEFEELTGFDPFTQITLAGLCQKIYTSTFMPEESIGVMKPQAESCGMKHEYFNALKIGVYGKKAIPNLKEAPKMLENVSGIPIMYANGKELYVFKDDFMHANLDMYKSTTHNPILNKTMKEIHDSIARVENAYTNVGYTINVMWKSEWEFLRLNNTSIKEMLRTFDNPHVAALDFRKAFFGGRTEVFKLHYKVKPGEKIHYYDFTSLYPTINYGEATNLKDRTKTDKYYYPVGHPENIDVSKMTTDDIVQQLKTGTLFGFIRCKVEPPKNLYMPVLPCHDESTGKLTFDLKTQVGTWCSPEILKALEKGYRIAKVYAFSHFKEKSNTLFADYVRIFLKIKQESSGYPEKCNDENGALDQTKCAQYVKDYKHDMGIDLEPSMIEHNPGRRLLAKLCLNTLWGRFGMRQNMAQNEVIHTTQRYYQLINDDAIDLNTFSWFDLENDDLLECVYKLKNNFIPEQDGYRINIPIAAFTTCYARLRLYDALEMVGDRAIYCDTDSLVFVQRANEENPLWIGDNLGDLTTEMSKLEDYIEEFSATAPKSYGYKTYLGKVECKVKGFCLNYQTSNLINYESIKGQVLGTQKAINVPITRFINDRANKLMKTVNLTRVQQISFDKRVIKKISEDYIDTFPHGYQEKS